MICGPDANALLERIESQGPNVKVDTAQLAGLAGVVSARIQISPEVVRGETTYKFIVSIDDAVPPLKSAYEVSVEQLERLIVWH
ncbi:hypothetical protein CHLRE_06g252743v5 [Chlamydomonas reinhardtii]|uniref:Uncharacterized protein n=1 Tax=Chlamydomonas reinhardtii TaxID=3055 RepID=A0A2K3DM36_CHLRE|nr:uncharacterized protein CHLRE_06g252743v5 [Chlamydomonas reinhardtii]PNW81583.1 hypothetical protein CHLRE_06g252743v5 [Chlamydomonas reinhardtii]